MTEQNKKVVSDYNGYDYKKIFWEDADRKYEDMADRLAIRRLLPRKMDTFVDIAGLVAGASKGEGLFSN